MNGTINKNAVVYSFHFREKTVYDNRCYKQLRYSIDTLRRYNKTIPIYVYVAPINNTVSHLTFGDNVKIINFVNDINEDWYKEWTSLGYAQFLKHRWENAVLTLSKYNLDNILYLDTDTVFYDDVQKLFDKYGDTDSVWAKPDNTEHIMHLLKNYPGMNDGQFILSKKVDSSGLLNYIKHYVINTLNKTEKTFTKKDHFQLYWIIVQYAVYDYFFKKNNPVRYFDENEVMLHLEPEYKDKTNLILQHYYNSNFEKVVPKEYISC